jgi:diacylglycerol kinase (ATP)
VALIVNPAAGGHTAASRSAAVTAELERRAQVSVFSGDSATATRAFAREARERHYAVLVLGGDGAAHWAIQELAGGAVPLGVIPAGTGNDIAEVLGAPRDPVVAARALLTALLAESVRRVDLGRTEDDAGRAPRWWFTILCAGFDSAVNERANRIRWPRGPRRYDLAIVLEAVRLRAQHYRLELDGEVQELDATMVSVCNAPQYGGGKQLAPHARIGDGRFDVCVVGPVTRRTLARMAPRLDDGGHIGHPAVSFHRARSVRIEADRVAYADGERIGPLPVHTHCVQEALAVLVPVADEAAASAPGPAAASG